MFCCGVLQERLGEALVHSNWLRNRWSLSRTEGELPILKWIPEISVGFTVIPSIGQKGFAFYLKIENFGKEKIVAEVRACGFREDGE